MTALITAPLKMVTAMFSTPFKLAKLVLSVLALLSMGLIWQQSQLAALALVQMDPVPETRSLVTQKRYAEAADYLDFFMAYDYVKNDPKAKALKVEIDAVRSSYVYQSEKMYDGLVAGTSDELSGQAVAVLTDFFVIGDLRDLAHQGVKYAAGDEVDELIVALATIGVVASTAQAVSGVVTVGTAGAAAPAVGASTAVKAGCTFLKLARKVGKCPSWIIKTIRESADVVKKTKKLDSVSSLFGDVYSLAKIKGGITLLDKTTDAASLRKLARVADTCGQHTMVMLRIGGETFIKTAQKSGELGVETLKWATTFGQKGMHLLDKMGPIKFVKLTARGGKLLYKGDFLNVIAWALSKLPAWAPWLLATLGIAVWMPWKLLARLSRRRLVTP